MTIGSMSLRFIRKRRIEWFGIIYVFLVTCWFVFSDVFMVHDRSKALHGSETVESAESADIRVQHEEDTEEDILYCTSPSEMALLGNQLFMVASAFGIAKTTGKHLVVDKQMSALKLYFETSDIVFGTVPPTLPVLKEKHFAKYDSDLVDRVQHNTSATVLMSYLQSWKYFHKFDISSLFTVKEMYKRSAQAYLQNLTDAFQRNMTFVGLHVRRGDMVQNDRTFRGYQVPPLKYYKQAMKYFQNKYQDVHFVVTSDEILWSCKTLSYFVPVSCSRGHRAGHDLALLSSCSHLILSSGTFSWWAGFLHDIHEPRGEVLYHADGPYRDGSELHQGFEAKDYFRPNWKPFEAKIG